MLHLLLSFSLLSQPSFAQTNLTALEGWQLDGNTRSTWDILWTCLSTILACTWTALHMSLTGYDSELVTLIMKILAWLGAMLGPEFMVLYAAVDFWEAKSTVARCNSVLPRNIEKGDEEKGLSSASPEEQIPPPTHEAWTLAQGFCIVMHGLVLQTEDDFLYKIGPKDIVPLIEAGVVKCCDLKERDIKDRAKADSFAKVFTVLQSVWATCNTVARAAYHLPVSPIELSAVAYVACALMSYALWWHKPRDMVTPIKVNLRYNHDSQDMPPQVRRILEEKEKRSVTKKSTASLMQTQTPRFKFGTGGGKKELTVSELSGITVLCMAAGLVFCGIHVAVWNFIFPTEAERTAWRVFSLLALCSAWPMFLVSEIPFILAWLFPKAKHPWLKSYVDPDSVFTTIELILVYGSLMVYMIARAGNMILIVISLRALPAGSFITIDWLATIPHV